MQHDTETDPDVDLIEADETATEGDETPPEADEIPEVDQDVAEVQDDDNTETFPRAVVEKLRRQNARYRDRAKLADTYAQRLHTELVRATGTLADPTDLEFDAEHLEDPDALAAAVEELLARKPHLAARRPLGDIGQGNRGSAAQPFNLLQALREHA